MKKVGPQLAFQTFVWTLSKLLWFEILSFFWKISAFITIFTPCNVIGNTSFKITAAVGEILWNLARILSKEDWFFSKQTKYNNWPYSPSCHFMSPSTRTKVYKQQMQLYYVRIKKSFDLDTIHNSMFIILLWITEASNSSTLF